MIAAVQASAGDRSGDFSLLLGAAAVMGAMWLWVAWDTARHRRYRAPLRWYAGYAPPEFVEPSEWDLQALRRTYPSESVPVPRGPAAEPEEMAEDSHRGEGRTRERAGARGGLPWWEAAWVGYAAAAAGVALITGLIHLASASLHLANISMLYLLVVIGAALRFGRGPAVAAALLAFVAFNWFFTEPRHTLVVRNPAEWLALSMFLVTATVTGQLTALLRARAEEARRREREAAALAEASWAVASQVDRSHALGEVLHRLSDVVEASAAAVVVPEPDDGLCVLASWSQAPGALHFDNPGTPEALRRTMAPGVPGAAARASSVEEDGGTILLPLATDSRVLGVLYLRTDGNAVSPEARRAIESLAHHAAVVLERERLSRAETESRVLKEADRLKTALLTMVSHDFRSPLASIKASASALREEGRPLAPATQQELLAGIEQEADRLNRMVGNILSLSRLEANSWRPQCEATDPAELVGMALGGLTGEQNRRIRVKLDPMLAELWLDPVQMAQVLHNLVDNALKYSPEGSTVEVVTRSDRPGAVVEVLDRGPGLSETEAEQIFERFYRAPAFQESSVPGVGIGLAVCRGLVEAHGGTLSAHPRPGGGAIFRIRLPLPPRGSGAEVESHAGPGHR